MITAIFLFPGMILHELSHALACILLGVKVTKTKLWGPTGASISHHPTTGWKNLLVAIAPFFVNTFLAIVFFYLGHIGLEKIAFIDNRLLPVLVFYWLGISFAYYTFPSETDRRSGWSTLWRHYKDRMLFKNGVLSASIHWISFPFLVVAKIALSLLALMDKPKAGLAWGIVLFLGTALYFAI